MVVNSHVKTVVTATIDEFLDQMALGMDNELEWAAFIVMLERRRDKLKARLTNGKG